LSLEMSFDAVGFPAFEFGRNGRGRTHRLKA
jgi:hypothetical protein